MWDLPRPGLEPVSPALAGRFSTTAPPGKPQSCLWYQILTALRYPSLGSSCLFFFSFSYIHSTLFPLSHLSFFQGLHWQAFVSQNVLIFHWSQLENELLKKRDTYGPWRGHGKGLVLWAVLAEALIPLILQAELHRKFLFSRKTYLCSCFRDLE